MLNCRSRPTLSRASVATSEDVNQDSESDSSESAKGNMNTEGFQQFPFEQYRVGSRTGVVSKNNMTFRPEFQYFRWEGSWHVIPLKYNQLGDKEIHRRMKIKLRNRGKTPWNIGQKHRPEWVENIRKTTKKAMGREDVRQNYSRRLHVHLAMSRATSNKKKTLERKKRKKVKKEVKLTPNERRRIRRRLKREQEALAGKVKPKPKKTGPTVRRPLSDEQKRKISEAIRKKWLDPVYRDQISRAMRSSRRGGSVLRPEKETKTAESIKECRRKYEELMSTVAKLTVEIDSLEIQRELVLSDAEVVAEIDLAANNAKSVIDKIKETVVKVEEELGIKSEPSLNGHSP